ncbi:hypothetical protein VM1G_08263 [Cytospora mali]|uniref:Uncharacterized protein n=1 Tax=Cytospora mali TaxID=578113 RepID=A0A194W9C2_CYTMA|nr:hypothetical protein VM1G_08263 [Valsa mali]
MHGRHGRKAKQGRATNTDADWVHYLPHVNQTGNSDGTTGSSRSISNGQWLSRRALAQAVRQLNIVGPVSRVLAVSQMPEDAISCFDFFRFRVGVLVSTRGSGTVDSNRGFWDRTLLQTAHAEPAVWNAVAALGALHRKWEVSSCTQAAPLPNDHGDDNGGVVMDLDTVSVKLAQQAGSCYTKALSLASSISDSGYMLVLSIALAVAASLAGKWSDNQVHIRAGQSLVSQIIVQNKGKPLTELEINDAAECLSKLSLQWASFSEERAPYPYADGLSTELAAVKEDREITTITQSLTVLLDINRRLLAKAGMSYSQQTDSSDTDMIKEEDPILRDFVRWGQQTMQVLPTTSKDDQLAYRTLLVLKLYHTVLHLLIHVGIARADYNELSWDDYLGHFERSITLSALIIKTESQKNPLAPSVVSLDEPGIIIPLWLTLSRCRHPFIRRRALGLLRSAKRQEGMWMSTSSAAVAERMIAIEEEGSPDISIPISVPTLCSTELCTTFELELAQLIEAEDHEPQSWVLGGDGFGLARTNWEVPGMVFVPLNKRITEVSVTCEPYNPKSMGSRADVTMLFAEGGMAGELRKQRISVNF